MSTLASRDNTLAAGDRRVVSFYGQPHPRSLLPRSNLAAFAMHLGFWDGRTGGHAQALNNMNRELAGRVELRARERVLDAGCGFGSSAIWMAEEVGAEVVGINLAPDQIYHARRLAYLRGLSHLLTFERADFTRTPFPEESFDVVWAVESVCHAQDKQSFLTEGRRLLRPGGRLVVADLFRTGRPFESDEEELLREWLSGWAIPDLVTAGEFGEYARQAGLVDIQIEDATANVWPSLRRIYRRALAAYPVAMLRQRLLAGSNAWASNARAGIKQYQALGRGLWLYGIFTATSGRRDGS